MERQSPEVAPVDPPPPPLFSSSPPRPPSAKTISTWPSSILLDIFLFVADTSPTDSQEWTDACFEDVCGGQLTRWRSHVCVKPLVLVCRGWQEAAMTALYRSVAINSSSSASHFLETLTDYPALRPKIKRLCTGFNSSHPHPDSLETSGKMVRILELCTNLSTLQLRLLHRDLNDEILHALHSVSPPLEAFVAGPQHYQQEEDVDLQPLPCHSVEAVVRGMKALRSLELNVWTEKSANRTKWEGRSEGEQGDPLPIKTLGIYSELDDEVLEGLLDECAKLETLDVYVEKDIRVKQVRQALRASTATMKSLRVVINTTSSENGVPPDPNRHPDQNPVLFDETLLPTYDVLERLYLCHNVTSPSIFSFLPFSGTLKSLSLHSLAPSAPDSDHFRFTPDLLQDLLDPRRTPHVDSLESVRIRDVRAEFGADELRQIQEALEARGVVFRWDEDGDSSNSGGSGSGSGSGSASGSPSEGRRTSGGAPALDPLTVPIAAGRRMIDGTRVGSPSTDGQSLEARTESDESERSSS